MQIINEIENIKLMREPRLICRTRNQSFCPKCKTQVGLVNVKHATEVLKISSWEIYQRAETGEIHRAHNSKGEIMLCFNSVLEAEQAAAEIDFSACETLVQINLSELKNY